MGYKGDSVMDCGYFYPDMFGRGLVHIPPRLPSGSQPEPIIIPWAELLYGDDPPNQVEITDEN